MDRCGVTDDGLRIVALAAAHDRTAFRSGSPPLDDYFRRQVTQDIRRRVTACFVAIANDERIAGFYTLASASIQLSELPLAMAKRLPRYPSVPAVRMGRLAVDQAFQGQGLGGALLADAIARCARSDIAAFSLLVEAKNEAAVAFYQHHGFIALADSPWTLFLPLSAVASQAIA
jgi:ribosomal protein S18 acetylase RimI-like enzyme